MIRLNFSSVLYLSIAILAFGSCICESYSSYLKQIALAKLLQYRCFITLSIYFDIIKVRLRSNLPGKVQTCSYVHRINIRPAKTMDNPSHHIASLLYPYIPSHSLTLYEGRYPLTLCLERFWASSYAPACLSSFWLFLVFSKQLCDKERFISFYFIIIIMLKF